MGSGRGVLPDEKSVIYSPSPPVFICILFYRINMRSGAMVLRLCCTTTVSRRMASLSGFQPSAEFGKCAADDAIQQARSIKNDLKKRLVEACHTAAEARVAQRSFKNGLKKRLVEAHHAAAEASAVQLSITNDLKKQLKEVQRTASEARVAQRLIRNNLKPQLQEAPTAAEATAAQLSITNDLNKQPKASTAAEATIVKRSFKKNLKKRLVKAVQQGSPKRRS